MLLPTHSFLQKTNAVIHSAQAVLVLIAGSLTLVVLTSNGPVGGASIFLFALCFLTLPALIYPHVRRFANVYAYATIDISCTIFWLAASTAVAWWNAAGIQHALKEPSSGGSCTDFAYGFLTKCTISKASVGTGITISLLFIVTSAISIHNALVFRRTARFSPTRSGLHGPAAQHLGDNSHVDDASKDTWSTSISDLDSRPPWNPFHNASDLPLWTHHSTLLPNAVLFHHPTASTSSRSVHHTPDGAHPGRPLSLASDSRRSHVSISAPAYDAGIAPSALSPTGCEALPLYRRFGAL